MKGLQLGRTDFKSTKAIGHHALIGFHQINHSKRNRGGIIRIVDMAPNGLST